MHNLLSHFVTAVLLVLALPLQAAPRHIPFTHPGPLLPDSSNFVTASLVVIAPGPNTVSAMGHSAIRLECPVHNLDYCFTLENDPSYSMLAFILGKTPTHDIAIPTQEFMKEFIRENRRVTQHELNLTLHEKQELWRAADNEFTNDGHRLFNYSYTGTDNCTSICYELIERSLIDDKIVVDEIPPILQENNGDYFRFMSRRSPWVRFLLITLAGTACDETWHMRNRMAPEIIVPLLSHSSFEDSRGKRQVLKGKELLLEPGGVEVKPGKVTPMLVFGLLLLVAVVLVLAERSRVGAKAARVFDAGLFTFQSMLGIMLVVVLCVGSIVGQHWNWYLIPFNPLPLVVWLCWRKRSWYPRVYGLYAVVLVLFILATPLSSQLDLEHQLLTAALAVRCAARYLRAHRAQ